MFCLRVTLKQFSNATDIWTIDLLLSRFNIIPKDEREEK